MRYRDADDEYESLGISLPATTPAEPSELGAYGVVCGAMDVLEGVVVVIPAGEGWPVPGYWPLANVVGYGVVECWAPATDAADDAVEGYAMWPTGDVARAV